MKILDRKEPRLPGRSAPAVFLSALAWAFLPLPVRAAGPEPLYPGDKSFEARFLEGNGATFFLRGRPGRRFIQVRTDPGASWPGVTFHPPGRAWDLTRWTALVALVRNDSPFPFRISIRADSARRGSKEVYIQRGRMVRPGKEAVIFIPLLPYYPQGRKLSFPGMRAGPPFSTDFDPSWITRLVIFASPGRRRVTFSILSLSILPADGIRDRLPPPWKFFPMIDRFGQYMHRDWPGKTYSVEELRGRASEEKEDLDAHPRPADRDPYGGWRRGPTLRAEGAFRVEKYRGKWWFVDPEGRLFWSLGMDCVGFAEVTPVSGRERFFALLPRQGSPGYRCFGISSAAPRGYYAGKKPFRTFNFLAWNLERKFGPSWRETYPFLAVRRLASWGFNTIGNWSDAAILRLRRMPYVVAVHYSSPRIEGSRGYWGKFPDVFHPSFAEALRRRLAAERNRSARDPWCIGYFVDNELTWGGEGELARAVLRSPPEQPAKMALLDFLEKRYKRAADLDRAWGTRFGSWKGLAAWRGDLKTRKAEPDLLAFGKVLYETYFRTVRDEIRRAAPGRLYLGCRFSSANPAAVKAAAKYCDVLSFNWYTYGVEEKTLPPGLDKPILIGEFHFGALDRGLFHPGLKSVPDQNFRASAFKSYLVGALKNPLVVGAHWFQYHDEPTTGRFDGENFQIGFTDICDTPYPEMVRAAREIGKDLYRIRYGR